jgi:hypothetical protein
MPVPPTSHETYAIGDLIGYRTIRGGIVKGKVLAVFPSTFTGATLVRFRVTGGTDPAYPRGLRQDVPASSAFLFNRSR